MKNLFYLFVFLVLSVQVAYAQETVYDNYVGTWKWIDQQSQSEFMIMLKKGNADWTRFGKGIKECIIGAYRYKKNGVVIVGNTWELSEQKRYSMYPIVLLGDKHYMRLYVYDYTIQNGYGAYKNMSGSSNVELIEDEVNGYKLKWVVADDGHEHIYVDEKQMFSKGTSLPTNIILTKIE